MNSVEHDTAELDVLPLTDDHAETVQGLSDLVASVRRHLADWDGRDVGGDLTTDPDAREAESAAAASLAHAVGSLERLTSAADALRHDLVELHMRRSETKYDSVMHRVHETGGAK